MFRESVEEYQVFVKRREGDGMVLSEQWHKDGKITDPPHCPAKRRWNPDNGVVVFEGRTRDGLFHADEGPSTITRDPETGNTLWEEWHTNGLKRVFTEGPSYVEYDPATGNKVGEEYSDGKKLHRDDAPAIVRFDPETGDVIRERFFTHGEDITVYDDDFEHPEP